MTKPDCALHFNFLDSLTAKEDLSRLGQPNGPRDVLIEVFRRGSVMRPRGGGNAIDSMYVAQFWSAAIEIPAPTVG